MKIIFSNNLGFVTGLISAVVLYFLIYLLVGIIGMKYPQLNAVYEVYGYEFTWLFVFTNALVMLGGYLSGKICGSICKENNKLNKPGCSALIITISVLSVASIIFNAINKNLIWWIDIPLASIFIFTIMNGCNDDPIY